MKSVLSLFCLCLFLGSPLIYSDDTGKNKTTTEKDLLPTLVHEIVVEGEAVEKAATVTVVTAEEIKAKGATTVAEALEMVPGAHVRVGGKGEAYVRLRGFRQREIAVLIDGVPVSSPYDGQLDLSSLPVDAVKRIDIVKGPSSVMYGANGMGGVINIITHKGTEDKNLQVNAQYGSGEFLQLGTQLQGKVKGVRYFFAGTYKDIDHFPLSGNYTSARNQGEGDRENSQKRSWSGRAGLNWNVGAKGKAGVSVTHFDITRGLPHHESDKKAKYWRFTDWRESIFDVFYQNSYGPLGFKSRLFYQTFENVMDSYDDRTYSTQTKKYAFTDSLKDHSVGSDIFFRLFPEKPHMWKLGIRFHHDVHKRQKDVGKPWEKYKMNTLSLPVEGEWKVVKFLTLIYGASLDLLSFDEVDTNKSKSKWSLNPQVACIVDLSQKWRFKASASKKNRFPTMKELFSSTSGNPELDPMSSVGLEAGFEFRPTDTINCNLVGFYNDVDNLIDRAKKYDPYINIDQAVFKGIEAGIQWQWSNASRLSLAYTWLKAEDKTSKEQSYIQYRPEHKVDVALNLRLPAGINAYFNGSYVSSQVYYDDNEEFKLDSYTLVDIKLSKKFSRLEVYLTAKNIFDVNYYESEGFPREGRQIFAGISYNIL